MSLILTAALAASTGVVPVCSWDRPGHRAFMGDVVAAVDRYADIPAPVREALKKRMAARQFDEMATIERDAIRGRFKYASDIREMHFDRGQLCATVTRDKWPAGASERGLVYCEAGHCIIVPTVCRNVARITRLTDRLAGQEMRQDPGDKGIDVGTKPGEPASAGAAPGAPVTAPPGPSFAALAGDPSRPPTAVPTEPAPLVAPAPLPLDKPPAPSTVVAVAEPNPEPAGGGSEPTAPIIAPVSPFAPEPGPQMPRDALPITPIPEPGVWVMMLAGVAVVVFLVRRRGGSD